MSLKSQIGYKFTCDICAAKFKTEVDLDAHLFNSSCEREIRIRDSIHFTVNIETSGVWIYTGACGYTGTDPQQFSNERGVALKRQGGCVTCEDCLHKYGAKP